MEQAPAIPSHAELLWPTLRAVLAIGGSASIDEIVEKVVELEGFTEEQQSVPHGDGPRSEIEYRLAWSRTYLKGTGVLDNSARGVWTVTDKGRSLAPILIALNDFADRWLLDPSESTVTLRHRRCGERVHATLACEGGHEIEAPADVMASPGPGARRAEGP